MLAKLTRRIFWFLGALLLAFLAISVLLVVLFKRVTPPTTAFMIEARVGSWFGDDAAPWRLQHAWVPYASISPQASLAVIASEDQQFPYHGGFDFRSIREAMRERESGRVRGASTITQQVAKNLFLWSGRSFVRKGLEAWFTLLVESFWSKQRILEVYLNVAELGRGVYGVEAAATRYFRKHAAQLTAAEAALLAAVLPNPRLLHADRPSAYVQRRQGEILGQMRALGGTRYLQPLGAVPMPVPVPKPVRER